MNNSIIIDESAIDFIQKYFYLNELNNKILTSIILVSNSNFLDTKICVESIKRFSSNDKYELIVIDNLSDDKTINYLKSQTNITLICNNYNMGISKSFNQGLEVAKGDNIVFLNSSVIVSTNWLYNLEAALYSADNIGAVGAVSNISNTHQQIDIDYNSIDTLLRFTNAMSMSNTHSLDFRSRLAGFCFMIKRSVLDKVGLFDENFTHGGYEFDDLSFRIICEDYKLLLCKNIFIHQLNSPNIDNSILQKNKDIINSKYGFNIDYSCGVRLDLINLIKGDSTKKLNVLEVGCGIGTSLLEIKNKYKNANLFGAEICENAVSIAKHNANVIVCDIENESLDYECAFFDYIIFGDVLEHLRDPLKTINKIRTYLKPNGYIISSIPNIMHTSVIRSLLNGHFHYENSGILDKTHLHFFTLHEIQQLFADANFNLVDVSAHSFPNFADDDYFVTTISNIFGTHLSQQFYVYQYLILSQNTLDLSFYENRDMLSLKYKLLRIEYDINVSDSLNYIFELYKKYTDDYHNHLIYLIKNNNINKSFVLNLIKSESYNRNLLDLYNVLGDI